MPTFRLALANVPFAATPDESVVLAQRAIGDASAAGAELVCFPESYVPGYRAPSRPVAPPDADFLERAWSSMAAVVSRDVEHDVRVVARELSQPRREHGRRCSPRQQ